MIAKFISTNLQMARMALQYLSGRKLRTALTSLAIVFGVALIFAVNLTLPSMLDSFNRSMDATSGTADIHITSSTGEAFAPSQPLQAVSGVSGIQAVTGALSRQITVSSSGNGGMGSASQIELVGVDPATAETVRHYIISSGRFLQPGDTGVAIVPASITDYIPEFKVGSSLSIATVGGLKQFTVVGFLTQAGNLAVPQIIVTLPDAQAALKQPGLINTIDASLQVGANRDTVTAVVKTALSTTMLGNAYAINAASSGPDILASVQIGYEMLDVMAFLALFLGAFLIFNTFRTVVLERRHDLAMLRAIGATRAQLMQMIIIESLLQGLIGTVIGLVLGYLMGASFVSAVGTIISKYIPGMHMYLVLSPSAVLGPIVLGVVVTLLAGYFPARAASRVSPMEGLRPTGTATLRRAARWGLIAGLITMVLGVVMLINVNSAASGAMVFLIGMVIAAPSLVVPVAQLFSPMLTLLYAREGDLARSNMTRQPGRVAITASTLMIGLATLIMIAALVNSFDKFVNRIMSDTFSSDLLVLPQSIGVYGNVIGADESLGTRVKALPEVQTVASLRYASSAVGPQALEVLGIDPQTYPQLNKLDFNTSSPDIALPALSTGRNALLTSLTALALKVKTGDTFVLDTPTGPQTYTVAAIANDTMTFKVDAIYISQDNLKTDFNKTEDVMLLINLKPGSDKNAALADVNQIVKDYPQFTGNITGAYRDSLMQVSDSALVLFYAMAILILIPASLGLLNTLTINILERTREIGIIRAVGGSRSQVRRIVTAEALLLGLFGASAGVLTGIAMSYGFIMAFSAIGWNMPYDFPFIGIIAAIIIGVLLALFAGILPARNAAKLDILRALQFE